MNKANMYVFDVIRPQVRKIKVILSHYHHKNASLDYYKHTTHIMQKHLLIHIRLSSEIVNNH